MIKTGANSGFPKHIMLPSDDPDEHDISLAADTIGYSFYLSYVTCWWPEFQNKPIEKMLEFLDIEYDDTNDSEHFLLYKKVYIKLEKLRKRLIRDSISNGL